MYVLIMVIENWGTTKGGEFVDCLCVGKIVCSMELVSQLVIGLGIELPVSRHGIVWLEWCNNTAACDTIDSSA
jgi:hypothetical protein